MTVTGGILPFPEPLPQGSLLLLGALVLLGRVRNTVALYALCSYLFSLLSY
jgi:hydrogenase/urease accessory protein HupE